MGDAAYTAQLLDVVAKVNDHLQDVRAHFAAEAAE